MHDENNRSLAEVTEADDIVISDNRDRPAAGPSSPRTGTWPTSSATCSTRADRRSTPGPASSYVTKDVPVSFSTVIESARRRGETAIGYQPCLGRQPAAALRGRAEPEQVAALTLGEGDSVIVLSER
ncbi:hypothetical protein [Nonomuraea dietziae]|uniref:hypothetical protein n=1 Tax=Nonomuraea dietziae TaxID=65515 RepID=UPI0031D71E30